MSKLILFLLIMFSASYFYADDEEEISAQLDKVLILPIENQSDTNNFYNTSVYQNIIFRSFYAFIGIIPVIEVPEEKVLRTITASDSNVTDVADTNNADYVIYGDYHFEGNQTDPKVIINLKAWNQKKTKLVFSKTYQTDTSGEIFNTIDSMMTDVLRDSLNIRFKAVALLSFKNFQIKNDSYRLLINDHLITTASNTNFAANLRILPNSDYRVKLIRNRDTNTVLQTIVRLKPNESASIGYIAHGRLNVSPIEFKDRNYSYELYLDDQIIQENSRFTNITANTKHVFRTVQTRKGKSSQLEKIEFSFADGGTNLITPRGKAAFPIHLKVYTLDNSMVTGGIDVFFGRYVWLGFGMGYSSFTTDPKNNPEDALKNEKGITFGMVSYTYELGMFLAGDMLYDGRMGFGFDVRNGNVTPKSDYEKYFSHSSYDHWNFGAFMDFEWKYLLFRPAFYLYQYNNEWKNTFGLGIGFKL